MSWRLVGLVGDLCVKSGCSNHPGFEPVFKRTIVFEFNGVIFAVCLDFDDRENPHVFVLHRMPKKENWGDRPRKIRVSKSLVIAVENYLRWRNVISAWVRRNKSLAE